MNYISNNTDSISAAVVHRIKRRRNAISAILIAFATAAVFLSPDPSEFSSDNILLQRRLLQKDMYDDHSIPDSSEIEKALKLTPITPNKGLPAYSLEDVVKAMSIFRHNFSVVIYDPEEDKFISFYNKNHPWYRGNAKLMGSFKVLSSSLRMLHPDRFQPGKSQEFAIAIGSGDLPSIKKTACLETEQYPCVRDDISPILQFGSVFRRPVFPSMIAMPMPQGNHLHCYHGWLSLHRESVCNSYLPRSPTIPGGLVFGDQVGLTWNDLIPQVVWRGTDFRYYIHSVRKELRQPNFEKDVEENLDPHLEKNVSAIQAMRKMYDSFIPRWKGVVWTAEAELEAQQLSDKAGNIIPWANIKFADCIYKDHKTPASEVEYYQKFGSYGIPAYGDFMSLEELAKYKYHIDLGGGGGTTWSGTLEKLGLPGLLFHHVTLTKDYLHDTIEPWVHYIPIKEDLSDLKEKFEWAESNPHLAQHISERATMLARSLGTLDGFQAMFQQFYEEPIRNVVEAYQPVSKESWRSVLERLTGDDLIPVMKCGGYTRIGLDCETLTDKPTKWKSF